MGPRLQRMSIFLLLNSLLRPPVPQPLSRTGGGRLVIRESPKWNFVPQRLYFASRCLYQINTFFLVHPPFLSPSTLRGLVHGWQIAQKHKFLTTASADTKPTLGLGKWSSVIVIREIGNYWVPVPITSVLLKVRYLPLFLNSNQSGPQF